MLSRDTVEFAHVTLGVVSKIFDAFGRHVTFNDVYQPRFSRIWDRARANFSTLSHAVMGASASASHFVFLGQNKKWV